MKKIISLILTVCMILTVISAGFVWAGAANKIDGTLITWSFDNTTKTLKFDGTGYIPNYDNYTDEYGKVSLQYPWKGIDYKTIVFSSGILSIGNYAFCYSNSLENVVIPNTVTSIGKGVFYNCSKLKSVTMSSKILNITDSLFSCCSSLETVNFATDTKSIGNQSFYRCSSLKAITLPDSVETIGTEAFSNCSGLKTIIMPVSLKSIGSKAFTVCETLEAVELNNNLNSIGSSAFSFCIALKSLNFPESISVIPEKICDYDNALETVTLTESVKEIQADAFYRCDSLKSIEIPYSVTTIAKRSLGFSSSTKLVENFELTGYEDTAICNYATENSIKFNSLGKYFSGEICEGIDWSFDNNTKTLSITGEGMMDAEFTQENLPIYIQRFDDIAKITISDDIIFIGEYAFYNLGKDCEISPLSAMTIGDYAFYNTGSSVTLSDSVALIKEKAFGQYDEDGNADATFEIIGKRFSVAEKFANKNGFDFKYIAPSVLTEKCGENAEWVYEPETKILSINGSGAMYDYSEDKLPEYSYYDVETLKIGENITSFGKLAFFGLDKIKEIEINPYVDTISENSVGYTYDAENKIVPIADFSIKGYDNTQAKVYADENEISFNSMGKFNFPSGQLNELIKWDYDAQSKTLTISGTGATGDFELTENRDFADYDIEKVVIENGITELGKCLLLNIKAKEISIPESVEKIGEYALGYEVKTSEDKTECVKIDGVKINCFSDSAAYEYANANGFEYNIVNSFTLPTELPIVIDEENKTIYVYSDGMKKEDFINACLIGTGVEANISDDIVSTGSTLEVKFGEKVLEEYSYKFIVNGDVDGNGVINSTDALFILLHTVEKTPLENDFLVAADLNNDNNANSSDALLALQISVQEIKPETLLPVKETE